MDQQGFREPFERAYLPALFAVASALLGLFLWFRDMPMVDLPQHALQLATWTHWDDPLYRQLPLELNLRTPYLLGYLLARALIPWVGLIPALKLVVWLAVVGYALALTALARRLGHSAWLGLLGFPTGCGYSFFFGFLSFIVALPLAILSLVAAVSYAARPRQVTGWVLAGLLSVTLLGHGVAFGMAFSMIAGMLVFQFGAASGPVLRRGALLWPLGVPVLLGLIWILPGSSLQRFGGDWWGGTAARLLELPASLFAINSADHFALVMAAFVFLILVLGLGRPVQYPGRLTPLALVLGGFCYFPLQFTGHAFMSPRFASFLLPGVLLAFRPRRKVGPALPLATACVLAIWLAVFGVRLRDFERECSEFHALSATLPPGLKQRSLVFERSSAAFPGAPLFLHFTAYYHAEKGGVPGYSFTMYPNSVVRLAPGVTPQLRGGAEWHPATFDALAEAALFDSFIVRSTRDRTRELFLDGRLPIVLEKHVGKFWVYRWGIEDDPK